MLERKELFSKGVSIYNLDIPNLFSIKFPITLRRIQRFLHNYIHQFHNFFENRPLVYDIIEEADLIELL